MGGNLNFGAHQLHFDVGGEHGFHLHKDPQALYIRDHDGHVLMTFGYGRIPTVYGNAPIATATKPAVYDLPLAAGWKGYETTCYSKTQDSFVILNVAIKATGVNAHGSCVATLPEGYRPANIIEVPAMLRTPSQPVSLAIHPDGQVRVYGAETVQDQNLFATATFVAA